MTNDGGVPGCSDDQSSRRRTNHHDKVAQRGSGKLSKIQSRLLGENFDPKDRKCYDGGKVYILDSIAIRIIRIA